MAVDATIAESRFCITDDWSYGERQMRQRDVYSTSKRVMWLCDIDWECDMIARNPPARLTCQRSATLFPWHQTPMVTFLHNYWLTSNAGD